MAEIARDEALRLARVVRAACIQAVLEGYEQARMDGLCNEGALEVALDAVRGLDLAPLMEGPSGTLAGE
jgi:hypothetical protein